MDEKFYQDFANRMQQLIINHYNHHVRFKELLHYELGILLIFEVDLFEVFEVKFVIHKEMYENMPEYGFNEYFEQYIIDIINCDILKAFGNYNV